MFDNNRLKFAAIGGGIILVIVIISQLPPEFVNRFIPWLFSSAVLVGGSRYWWTLKKQLDLRYPPTRLTPYAAIYEKFLNEFSNHILAFAAVAVTCFFIIMAGRTTLFFFGKTTLATAQDAGVILTQKIADTASGAASTVGSGIQYMVSAGSSFDPQVDPEELDFRKQYSLLGGTSSGGSYSAPQSGAPVQNAVSPVVEESAEPEQQSAAPEQQQVTQGETSPLSQLQTVANQPLAPLAPVVVQSGDTLCKIAKRVYGDCEMWPALLKANPALGDGNTIYAGTQLTVPPAEFAATVTVNQVMPPSFNNNAAQSVASAPAYGPSSAPPPTPVVIAQSDNGALVQHSSGWGVEVVTNK